MDLGARATGPGGNEHLDAAPSRRPAAYKGTRPGGRSARVREAVLAATAAELLEHGFADMSLGRIAVRAGVAPTTVHRRWGTRGALVADMLHQSALTVVPDPQYDTLEEDLRFFAGAVAAALGYPGVQTMLRGMFALPPEELAPLKQSYWEARFAVAQAIIDRAIERGELPEGTNGWSVMERVLAPIWMRRLITETPLAEGDLDAIVDDALMLARLHARSD